MKAAGGESKKKGEGWERVKRVGGGGKGYDFMCMYWRVHAMVEEGVGQTLNSCVGERDFRIFEAHEVSAMRSKGS